MAGFYMRQYREQGEEWSFGQSAGVDAGPCLKCGHPPRCHPYQQCDSSLYTKPCGDYVPDPKNIIKLEAKP